MTYRSYLVGPSRAYPTINDALAALVADGPELTEDVEITVMENGVYPPFSIPQGVRPTSTARLTIKASTGVIPVVDYRPFLSTSYVADIGYGGILLNEGTKYVTLQGLHVRAASTGIHIPSDCDGVEIDKCVLYACQRGVYATGCQDLAITNSILGDCSEYAVALNQVKNAAIAHSTLFNNYTDRAGFYLIGYQPWAQSTAGDPASVTGLLHLYKNIFVARSGFAISCRRRDVDKIRSDLNLWWIPNAVANPVETPTTGLAKLFETTWAGLSFEYVQTLAPILDVDDGSSWQSRTQQDLRSLSDDPVFRSTDSGDASVTDSLYGRPSSFITSLFMSPNMALDDEDLFPAFLRQSLLLTDLDSVSRLENASNGAYQVQGVASLDVDPYDDQFTDPTGEATGCEPDIASVTIENFKRAVPVWNASLTPGPFFIRDQEFWLYGQKRAVTLGKAQRTKFQLASLLVPSSVSVMVAGTDVTDTARWDVNGYVFTLYHEGLEVEAGTDVVVTATTRIWNQSTLVFDETESTHRFKIRSGISECVLPSEPTMGSPVVVTDDLLRPLDSLDLAQEFRLTRDPYTQEVLLEFGGAKNLWSNPDFAYTDEETTEVSGLGLLGTHPLEHDQGTNLAVVGFTEATGDLPEIVPLRAGKALLFGEGTTEDQWVGQYVEIDPELPHVFSLYAASLEAATGDLEVRISWFDRNFDEIYEQETFTFGVPEAGTSVQFRRFGVGIWVEDDETPGKPALSSSLYESATTDPPDSTRYARIRIHGRMIAVDAVQLEVGHRPTAFTRLPRGSDLTIEYEEGDGSLCRIKDLNLQPVRSAAGAGFLSIAPIPARQWDLSAPAGVTTVSDYQWPWGRLNLLPWAKLSGFNKYRGVSWFSTNDRRPARDTISLDGEIGYPRDIQTTPSSVTAVQGGDGAYIGVEVFDQFGNPYTFGDVRATVADPTGEWPGDLCIREWGLPVSLGPSLTDELDEAGAISFSWIPPGFEDVQFAGAIPDIEEPTTELGGLGAGFIRTRYRPDRLNHGNVRLFDSSEFEISPTGEMLTSEFFGLYSEDNDYTRVILPRMPWPGSVSVFASDAESFDTPLEETWSSPPLLNRQFDVNYEEGSIDIRGYWGKPFRVVYSPRRFWLHPLFDRRVYLAQEALEEVTTEQIFVRYDAEIDLYIEALPPRGFFTHDPLERRVRLVAQHPFRSLPAY